MKISRGSPIFGFFSDPVLVDVNGDKTVDIMDVIKVNKVLLGIEKLDDNARKCADVNADGNVDSDDSLNLLKFVVGNIAKLPVK